jgi:group I intron endonuclease
MMGLFVTSYDNYKTSKIAGVYTITNNKNGKVYIGETVNLGDRLSSHINDLLCNSHCNRGLQKDFKQYGINNFSFRILKIVDNMNKNELINILLYLEAAYYRKYEKDYDFYNIVIPYEEIDQGNINMPNYTINYNAIKNMLDNDPYNIEYDKIDWTPAPPPSLKLNEIINQKSDYDANKFELALSTYKDKKYSKMKYKFFQTFKYSECQHNSSRSLLCILKEVGTIKITNRREYFGKAYLSKGVSDKYIYQDDTYFSDKAKTKKYLNCQKPMMLSYQAQLDIINYLENLTDEMLNKIDTDYKQFQIDYFMKNSHSIDRNNYLNGNHKLPYEVNSVF